MSIRTKNKLTSCIPPEQRYFFPWVTSGYWSCKAKIQTFLTSTSLLLLTLRLLNAGVGVSHFPTQMLSRSHTTIPNKKVKTKKILSSPTHNVDNQVLFSFFVGKNVTFFNWGIHDAAQSYFHLFCLLVNPIFSGKKLAKRNSHFSFETHLYGY